MKEYWLSTNLAFHSFNNVGLTMDGLEKIQISALRSEILSFSLSKPNYITHNAALPTSVDIEGSSVRSGLSHFYCSHKTCEQTVMSQICALYPLIDSTLFFSWSAGIHCWCMSVHSFSSTGGETQVSSFHLKVSHETVCVDWVPQCCQSVRRRLEATGRVLALLHLLHLRVICACIQ